MSLKALILNCSLKKSSKMSNSQALAEEVIQIFNENDVESDTVRLADYNIAYGIADDMGDGDEWPDIFEKVKESDILIVATPLWLGEKSSIATLAIERLYGGSSLKNDKGQSIYYNKVGGVVVTGNEDGAKNAARSILYGFSHIGLVIPPNVDTYWVGEAGPGKSYIDAKGYTNDFTQQHARMMAYNLIHFAEMLNIHPIPAEGNILDD